MRTDLSLDLAETLFIIGLVIPGLICIYLGLRTWKKDWLAMETSVMVSPLLFIFFYFFGLASYISYYYPDWDLVQFIGLISLGLFSTYIGSFGQILVLRGNRDVVLRGVQGILDRLGLQYTLNGDRFDLPEINMKIKINHFERSDLVGIQTPWRRVPIWSKEIHEEILNLCVGRPSERYHPAILVMGLAILGTGAALGVMFAIG